MPRNKTPDHKPFLALASRIERLAANRDRIVLQEGELAIVTEHIAWFKKFMEQRKHANSLIKHRGTKHMPDHLIKPASLQRRAQRAIKVIKRTELAAVGNE